MRKNNRKGFTIVELVIVIAVIAILAAVLIPTFAGIVSKANDSAAVQEANAIYKNYTAMVDYADGDSAEQDLVIKVSDKEYIVVKGAKMQDEVYDTEKEAVAALGVNGVKLYETDNADVKDKVFVVCSKHEHAVCTDTKCKHCGYVMAAGTCTDSNADSKCDVCGADMPAEESSEDVATEAPAVDG